MDIINYQKDKDILTFKNNRDWFESYYRNPRITEKIAQIGVKNQSQFRITYLFKPLYDLLFQLGPELKKDYEQLLESRRMARDLYCVQIRIGGKRDHVSNDYQFNNRNVTVLFWDFITKNFIKDDDYKLFVTTDLESVALEALNKFGKDKVIVANGLYTHIDRESQSESCSRVKKTYLDLHFMQNCQKIVISNSNYGKFGTLLRPDWTKDSFIYINGEFKSAVNNIQFEPD